MGKPFWKALIWIKNDILLQHFNSGGLRPILLINVSLLLFLDMLLTKAIELKAITAIPEGYSETF